MHNVSMTDLPPVPAWLDEIEGERALAWVAEHNAAKIGRAHV